MGQGLMDFDVDVSLQINLHFKEVVHTIDNLVAETDPHKHGKHFIEYYLYLTLHLLQDLAVFFG
jgi:hypothetical protein